eukprot:11713641-Alexandrium_andersonii.AAC.1
MSASLVGSEMCIRDRRPALLGASASPGPFKKCFRHAPSALVGAGGRGPVSYTHLTLPTICSV